MTDSNADSAAVSNADAPAGPQVVTPEQLLAQVAQLTNNQNSLIATMNSMQRKMHNPFMNFKIPDQINIISNFNGNKKETLAWVKDTQEALDLFEDFELEPSYKQIMRVVKSKIVGEAREVLIAAGNPTEWADIKEVLLNAFGDRRDITSHIQSLFFIKQGKYTLNEYFHRVKSIDTAIKSTAAQMEDYRSSTEAVNKLISLMSLTRYIDGLNGENLAMYVRSYRPKTLEEAHEITTQHSNASFRQKLENRQGTGNPKIQNFNQKAFNQNRTDNPNFQQTGHQNKPQFSPNRSDNQKNNQYSDHNKSNSGKFRYQKPIRDDDVSMKTAKSRMEVNNHDDEEECEHRNSNAKESETQTPCKQPDDSVLESDDDEYFVDELNFHVGEAHQIKR